MAIPRKGSRLITVDGKVYRWAVRHKPTYVQGLGWAPLTFAVEDADTPGQVLSVATRSMRLDNWLGLPGTPMTPQVVEQSIRTALTAGWEPDRSDGAFKLVLDGSSVKHRMGSAARAVWRRQAGGAVATVSHSAITCCAFCGR